MGINSSMFYPRTIVMLLLLVSSLFTSIVSHAQNSTASIDSDQASPIPPFMTALEEDVTRVTFYVAKAKDPAHATFDEVVGEFLEARDAMMKNKAYDDIELNRPLVVFYMLDKKAQPSEQVFAAGMDFQGLNNVPTGLQKISMPAHTARVVFFKGPYSGTPGSKQDKAWTIVCKTEKNKLIPAVWFGYEVYLISYDKTDNEAEFVTKVCLPIEIIREKKTDIVIPKKSTK